VFLESLYAYGHHVIVSLSEIGFYFIKIFFVQNKECSIRLSDGCGVSAGVVESFLLGKYVTVSKVAALNV